MKQNIFKGNWLMYFLLLILFSCGNTTTVHQAPVEDKLRDTAGKSKPPSSFTDTLTIRAKAAVFYEPDSVQLEKIKAVTEDWIFRGSMHEYEFQQKSAHRILKRDWPDVEVVEARKVRYLAFVRLDGKKDIIDLDKHGDPFGLFVFNRRKAPRQVEMTNAESLIPDYFDRD